MYSGGDALPIEAFAAGNGTLGTTPTSQSSHIFGSASVEDGQGAGLSVSSNGNNNGILWALDNSGFNNNPAVLYAYDATNLNTVLWTSSEAARWPRHRRERGQIPDAGRGQRLRLCRRRRAR